MQKRSRVHPPICRCIFVGKYTKSEQNEFQNPIECLTRPPRAVGGVVRCGAPVTDEPIITRAGASLSLMESNPNNVREQQVATIKSVYSFCCKNFLFLRVVYTYVYVYLVYAFIFSRPRFFFSLLFTIAAVAPRTAKTRSAGIKNGQHRVATDRTQWICGYTLRFLHENKNKTRRVPGKKNK